jgi:hypothetical protein
MRYPILRELNTSREMLDVFKGYNHNLRIGDGEFYEMTNLSSDHYPILSPRSARGVYAHPGLPQGIIAKDSLCYIDGGDFVINGYRVPMGLTADDTPKNLISMGTYVIIMPDKKYVNTQPKEGEGSYEYGLIEAYVETTAEVSFTLCKVDGVEYANVATQSTAPPNPENMALWIDTSSSPHTLKQYSTTSNMWSAIATTYIKISSPGIGMPFSVNDGVTISGVKDEALADLNASCAIWAKGDGYIVVKGILDKVTTQTEPIKVERKMPKMDFIIESGNRLWGCRYGVALNGEIVNEIYASKLGDFKNWNCFIGISTDSYAVSLGTDGAFTGAITHLGYPLFFKENCVHKVYGNYPANYQIQTTTLRGVQKDCHRSLAIVNEVLYYKSRSGVCAYDGSLPTEISSALGNVMYGDAVAGALGNKYYISMQSADGACHLFVYDTLKGMWHREDDTQALDFCNCRGDLYYIDRATDQIKTVGGTGVKEPDPIKWSATTGFIGTNSPDKKYISRLDVRMKLDVGARAAFFAEYDSSGDYEYLFAMTGKSLQSFAVPIRPKRCDHMRLRIVGTGDAKIFSICKTIEWGSDK